MKSLARKANRFPRSMDGQTVRLDEKMIHTSPEKIDTDQKMMRLGLKTGAVSRLRIVSGPKSIDMD
jgi:hypothetical protein